MITTVTLNAAVDKTYYMDSFATHQVNRVRRVLTEPGGKGNNVAKIIKLLGGEVTASGCIGGDNGQLIDRLLQTREISTDFVIASGESRICLNLIDESSQHSSTELLEPGLTISSSQWIAIKQKIQQIAQLSTIIVFSGSLPQGVAANGYAELIEIVQQAGVHAFLDTSGVAFTDSIQARPYFIKPNQQELEQWTNTSLTTDQQYIDAAWLLVDRGIEKVCITRGSQGSIAIINKQVYQVISPSIQAINTVGCGDAFVAGMAFATSRQYDPVQQLKLASAVATANALSEKAGDMDYATYLELESAVQVIPL
ncbi:1-phosphofructokinase family hexose kinase [Paenibacillus nicotianae]|uniref:Tagatose-6-phosphate kinase n=1 Tax=Paenibacillus nicotianae TaxID=1526551 RepID=A0ABW4UVD8_9BACL